MPSLAKFRKWLTPTRLSVRWTAAILVLASLALLLVALKWPIRTYIGPLRISLRSTRNPLTVLIISTFIWYMTSHRNFARLLAARDACLNVWKHSSLGRRVVLCTLVANVAAGTVALLQYPNHLVDRYLWCVIDRECVAFVDRQEWHPRIVNFAERCKVALPPDARVLYHGHIESMEFAYEVYPRRVFMLPGDFYKIAGSWQDQDWLKGMPEDSAAKYWEQEYPAETTDRETFIREHGITHEVFFDRDDWMASRWETVR